MHDSWINSYFSASEQSITMRFSILRSSIFLHSQNLKKICDFNDKKPNRNIWIQNIQLFKMANFLDKNVHAEKRGSTNWSKMRLFSFQKIDSHFVHWNPGPNRPIFRNIRGRHILPVKKCDKIGFNVQPSQSQKWRYHWCLP